MNIIVCAMNIIIWVHIMIFIDKIHACFEKMCNYLSVTLLLQQILFCLFVYTQSIGTHLHANQITPKILQASTQILTPLQKITIIGAHEVVVCVLLYSNLV